jgi:hypothetical protein
MADGREELRIEPRQASQMLSIGFVGLAGVLVDQTQPAGVGYQDLMPELLEQAAGPTRVGAGLHGHPAGWQAGELAPEGRFRGGDACFLDGFALLIQDEDIGALVTQVQTDESRAILDHGRFLLLAPLSAARDGAHPT